MATLTPAAVQAAEDMLKELRDAADRKREAEREAEREAREAPLRAAKAEAERIAAEATAKRQRELRERLEAMPISEEWNAHQEDPLERQQRIMRRTVELEAERVELEAATARARRKCLNSMAAAYGWRRPTK